MNIVSYLQNEPLKRATVRTCQVCFTRFKTRKNVLHPTAYICSVKCECEMSIMTAAFKYEWKVQ